MPVEMPVEMRLSLNATAQQILCIIAKCPSITMARLAEDLAVNRRTVERNIKTLQDKGLLVREGPTKNGSWRVVI
jgi:predicted HTH transcriptional regulator